MAKAKNKEAAVSVDFPQRVKDFEAGLLKLIQTHQVGLRPELAADRTKIVAILNYIDLAELKKLDAEAKAKQATK